MSREKPSRITSWPSKSWAVGSRRAACEVSPGIPDSFRVDIDGNIWASAGDGVHCITPDGHSIGKSRFRKKVANARFGGRAGDRLDICGHKVALCKS